MEKTSNKKILSMIYTALAIAMVTLSTMAIRIPSPKGGYVNFGDILIFTTAVLIGKRTGFIAGGIGSALADILGGYAIYAPGTFIIKGLEGLICGILVKKNDEGKINIPSLVASLIISSVWMIVGYFIYEYALFGIGTALPSIPGNMVQGFVSAIASIPVVLSIRKTKLSLNIENK